MSDDVHEHSGGEGTAPSHGRRNLAFAFFAVAAGYCLLTEHYEHTMRALPWVVAFACPLMHVFMHRGHGSGKAHGQ